MGFKPTNETINIANGIKEKIRLSSNVEASVKAIRKDSEKYINDIIKTVVTKASGIGVSLVKNIEPNVISTDYTQYSIKIDGIELGILVFRHTYEISSAYINTYLKTINDIVYTDTSYHGIGTQDYKKVSKSLIRLSNISDLLSQLYSFVDLYNKYNTEISSRLRQDNDTIDEIRRTVMNSDNLYQDLMSVVSEEVYKVIKGRTFKFEPKTIEDLVKVVDKNQNYFKSMDGQSLTYGERSRFTMFGGGEKTYKAIISDFINTNVEQSLNKYSKNKILPIVVAKGIGNGFPTTQLKITGVAKNVKADATILNIDNYKFSIIPQNTNNTTMISPSKYIDNGTFSDNETKEVMFRTGGILGLLALYTNELDEYIKLFKE